MGGGIPDRLMMGIAIGGLLLILLLFVTIIFDWPFSVRTRQEGRKALAKCLRLFTVYLAAVALIALWYLDISGAAVASGGAVMMSRKAEEEEEKS